MLLAWRLQSLPKAKWWELELAPQNAVKMPVLSTAALLPFINELKKTFSRTDHGACATEGNSEAQSDRENKNLAEIMPRRKFFHS